MSSKGLTKDIIIAQADALMEEGGQSVVSLHELARRLEIKTPSLYNHIKSTKDLQYQIFRYAIDKLVANQNAAVQGKQIDEAVAHRQSVLRAVLHGFISQEDLGYFYYYKDADPKKSRDIAVQCFLNGLHAELGY